MEHIDAFNFAADTTRHVVTASTAILTLTVTFAKDTFLKNRTAPPISLRVSWVSFVASILFGILTMMALSGAVDNAVLAATDDTGTTTSIFDRSPKIYAGGMVIAFVFGIICMVVAGWRSVDSLIDADKD